MLVRRRLHACQHRVSAQAMVVPSWSDFPCDARHVRRPEPFGSTAGQGSRKGNAQHSHSSSSLSFDRWARLRGREAVARAADDRHGGAAELCGLNGGPSVRPCPTCTVSRSTMHSQRALSAQCGHLAHRVDWSGPPRASLPLTVSSCLACISPAHPGRSSRISIAMARSRARQISS